MTPGKRRSIGCSAKPETRRAHGCWPRHHRRCGLQARGIEVCPSIGANAISVAEYVIATAMNLLRGSAYYVTDYVAGGGWERAKFSGAREIAGLTMGVIGFGSIGQTTGDKARALGMDVIAYDAMLPAERPPGKMHGELISTR